MRIISGAWKGRRLRPLRGKNVRPTTDRVREAWMSALGGRLDGLRVVDLFAGSGALGLEALSRGAEHVTFVERARTSLRVLEANIDLLGAGAGVDVVSEDVFHWMERRARSPVPAAFDVALADPPYGSGDAHRLAAAWVEHPFARELWVEHPWRETLDLPVASRTRRYGDTAITAFENEP